ncbi:ATP-dependent DNA helicase [Caerostris darwini]|uniref:ATP-dependent DNA helicase n=1 Tax=Caerostris darwini TaxID=1538125 RepID=A0AAV4QNN4_9ARAC|nr:ATP-dependent DNA helicase [Caerostris darwini]
MGTKRGREFCRIMDEIYYMTSRNNIAQYTTRAWTSIDAVFSTHSVGTCGLNDCVFSHHLPLHVQVPWEETRLRTADPPEDDDPRLECGPWNPWNRSMEFCRTN